MRTSSIKPGQTFTDRYGESVTVTEYESSLSILVEWEDGFTKKVTAQQLKSGKLSKAVRKRKEEEKTVKSKPSKTKPTNKTKAVKTKAVSKPKTKVTTKTENKKEQPKKKKVTRKKKSDTNVTPSLFED